MDLGFFYTVEIGEESQMKYYSYLLYNARRLLMHWACNSYTVFRQTPVFCQTHKS